MDDQGRLLYQKRDGSEFVGQSYDETGVMREKAVAAEGAGNRAERRAIAAHKRKMAKSRLVVARK